MATETDAEGYVISYEYDGNRNMVKKTTVDGDTINVYDPLDRLISTTTPDGESESFEYDGIGQIVTSTDKGGYKTSYTYDGNGNLVKTTDPDGCVTEYAYNAFGLETHINYNGGKQMDYAHNKTDDLVKMGDWSRTITYEIDPLHRITSTTDRLASIWPIHTTAWATKPARKTPTASTTITSSTT